ncbi:MAG: hypothetical protein R3A46_15045 [Thermomicrobiales bacterium]
MARLMIGIAVISMFGLIAATVFHYYALLGQFSPQANLAFRMAFVAVIIPVLFLSKSAVSYALLAAVLAVLGGLQLLFTGAALLGQGLTLLADRLYGFVRALLDIPAGLGRRVVNWLASFEPISTKLHISRLEAPNPRRVITPEDDSEEDDAGEDDERPVTPVEMPSPALQDSAELEPAPVGDRSNGRIPDMTLFP